MVGIDCSIHGDGTLSNMALTLECKNHQEAYRMWITADGIKLDRSEKLVLLNKGQNMVYLPFTHVIRKDQKVIIGIGTELLAVIE